MKKLIPTLLLLSFCFSGCVTVEEVVENGSGYTKPSVFDGQYYQPNELDELATVNEATEPSLSRIEIEKKGEGWARIELIVDEEGNPTQIQSTKASDVFFARKAEKCVSNWTFKPGKINGKDVKSYLALDLDFSSRFAKLRKIGKGEYKDTPTYTKGMNQTPHFGYYH